MEHLKVTVFPEAKEEKLVEKEGKLHAYVKQEAQDGKANEAAVQLVRDHKEAGGQVQIVSGHTQQQKIMKVTDGQ